MLDTLIERIRAAHENQSPLIIQGGGSKTFYGGADEGEVLSSRALTGVVEYQPKELVLTARAGTPLAEIETLLAEQGQMLAFEPPHFGECPLPNPDGTTKQSTKPASGQVAAYLPQAGEGANAEPKPVYATLGGCIAAGLSGPRRPYAGAARDFVLGVRMIDGTGQPLRFGGQVIKNVAGYDVSRLMVGALGTLGLLTEVSLKVLPRPAAETTLQFELDEAAAILKMNQWAGQPLPLSATSWHAGLMTVRLSGAASAVQAARAKLGGEALNDAGAFWQRLRDQATPFFDKRPLWRLAVKPTTPPLNLGDAQWIEWGGAVRWMASDRPATTLREAAKAAGGHATLFRGDTPPDGAFTPLSPALATLHRNLKQRFDPRGIFNHGRLYPDF
jgi:glycolate oxidase FAD binding subunit